MASSGQTISSDALRYFRYHYFVRHWGKEVFFLVFKHLFLAGQSKTIHRILVEKGVSLSSSGEYSFNSNEICKMSGRPEDLDITLMNKICWKLWDIRFGFPGKRMKNLMTNIRTERNAVSHEDCKISETELHQKVNSFQTMLEETLDEAKSLWPSNGVTIDLLKTGINDAVPNLLEKIREKYDPSDKEDLNKLEEEIKGFWDQLFEFIIQLTHDELKILYGRLSKICFFDWLVQYRETDPCGTTVSLKMDQQKEFRKTDPCGTTVSLKMDQQKEFRGYHKGEGCITVDQNEILDIKDPDGKDAKAVIISGCAGAGKSTIMCSILEKWHKGNTDMPNLLSFQILLYFPFRNHIYDKFDKYLESLLPNTLGLFDLKHVKSAIMSSKCLILCDGYDEANDSSRKLFEELITLNFRDMKVVVTTRPGCTEGLTNIIKRAKHDRINLNVLGLREEDMKPLLRKITAYLLKCDVTRKEMERELFQVIDDMNRTAKIILATPLYFNLFTLLYIQCPEIRERIKKEKIISVSTLYILFEEHKKDRIIEKIGIKSELVKEFDNIYLRYSMQNYKEGKYELSQTEVDDMKSQTHCQEVIDNFDSLLSSYFNLKHSIKGLKIVKTYCYRHATELEFAAARKITEDIIKSYRAKTGNIVRSILISNGIWELLQRSHVTENFFTIIVEILYNFERNVFYSVIDDVHNSLLTLTGEYFDLLLKPCMITSFDSKVVDSLTSTWKCSSIDNLRIKEASSVFVLPQLLRRMEPKCVEIISNDFVSKDFLSYKKTAEVARDLRIPIHLEVEVFLKEIPQMSPLGSFTVDKLDLEICDNIHEVDVNTLCPFPISSKDLSMNYDGGYWRSLLEVSHIINTVFPRANKDVSETESKGESSSCPSTLEIKHPKLIISLLSKGLEADEDIRLLLQSLNVQPLRKIYFPHWVVSSEEIRAELSRECRKRGFGKLVDEEEFQLLIESEEDESDDEDYEEEVGSEEEVESEEEDESEENVENQLCMFLKDDA